MSIDRRSLLASSATVLGAAVALMRVEGRPAGPPVAPVRPIVETLFGTAVSDPYRWMEAEGPEWKIYTEAQGAFARRALDSIPGWDDLYAAVRRYSIVAASVRGVQTGGEYIFSQVRPAGAETSKLFVRKCIAGADRLLVDPDVHAPAGSHASLDWWVCSPDGSYVVFGTSPGGSEFSTTRVIATASGELLPEIIGRTEDAGPNWTEDSSGFFYTRLHPGAAPGSPDKFKLSACWFHRLNTDPSADVEVLAKGADPKLPIEDIDSPWIQTAPGSGAIIGGVTSGTQHELALYASSVSAAEAGRPKWRSICVPADAVTDVMVHGEDIFLLTHKDAQRFKITKATVARPLASDAVVVVPESGSVIRGFAAAKDALYFQDLNAGLGGVRRLSYDTGAVSPISLPFEGAISSLHADTSHDGAWVKLQSWVRPPVICHIQPDCTVTQTDIQPKLAVDLSPTAGRRCCWKRMALTAPPKTRRLFTAA
jgi:prolyl oligopeptidase